MSRHFFPGGNTPAGFHSYFDNISFNGERTIYLKGASGCGKSTFMKKTAAAFENIGFEVEFFHCSNDAESLDGICVPKAEVSIIDGTAPHISDPAVPVARDEIFNMADFINPETAAKRKDELSGLLQMKKQCFDKAYGYLAAACSVYRNNTYIYSQCLDMAKLNASIIETLSVFDQAGRPVKAGRNRKLFASALTPDGFVNFLESLINKKTIYILVGETGSGTDIFLERIRETANLRGFDSESLYCPLTAGKLEHLIIPEMELCFTTSNKYYRTGFRASSRKIDFADFLNKDLLAESKSEMDYNSIMFEELAGKAAETLASQRILHERIEEIYISAMDFDKLTSACDGIISGMLEKAL